MSQFRTLKNQKRTLGSQKNSISDAVSQQKLRDSKVSTRMAKPKLLQIDEAANSMQQRHNSAATINFIDEKESVGKKKKVHLKMSQITELPSVVQPKARL